ncbi:sulfurtransferase/chromate resistance protein [Pseudophaeobacter sp.]|uniref:sulfurtransferase/chromate resistance protein n=1 Tax=Pseudophaeobacter sp. TaxID=1971739 RepID=UPI0032977D74
MAAPNEITPPQLLRLIGTPTAPHIVDICTDEDFDTDPHLIPGSFRHPHADIEGLKARIGSAPCVIVCQRGLKLSQGLTSWLRSEGLTAEYLKGGMFAWRDLRDAPRVPVASLPGKNLRPSLWVTRHRPKIDRIACPWLIRRFVDPQARFLFISPAEVAGVADRYGATAFDTEGGDWSHQGDRCSFDTMLDRFSLRTAALDRVATVVRAADTNRHDLAPEAAGLLALSVGLSRQYRDDHQQLEAGFHLYDALYRWARDGQGETHDWPMDKKS